MLAPETPGKMPPLASQPAIDKLPAAIQTGIDSIFDLIKEEREKAANAARQEAWEARHAEREQAITRIQEMEAEKVAQRGERESLRARIGELERELSRTGQRAMDALQDKHEQLAVHANQKIDALESRVGTLLEKLATTEKGLQDLEASYNDQALVLEKKTSEANDGAKTIADLTARVAELQAELASSRTWSDSITEQLRLINSGVGRQTQMLQATEEQRADSITKLHAAEQEIQALKTSSQVEAQKWEGERTALKSEIADLSAKHTTAIRKVETLQTAIDNNTRKFEQQRQYRKNKEAEAKTEKGRLSARITELEHALGRAGSRVQELEQSLADAKGQYGQLATAVNESGFIQVRDSTIVITAELINFVVALATHTAVVDQPQSLVNAPPMTLCATLTRCEKATLQMRDRNQELERQVVAAQDETRRAMTDLAAARAEKATTATTISGLQQENERLGKDLERVKEVGLKYKIALKAREGGCPKLSSAASGRPEARAKTSPTGCPSNTSSTGSMKSGSVPAKRPPPSSASAAPPSKVQRMSEGSSPMAPSTSSPASRSSQPSDSGTRSPSILAGTISRKPSRPTSAHPPVIKQERTQTSAKPLPAARPTHKPQTSTPTPRYPPSPASSTASTPCIPSSLSRPHLQHKPTTDPRLKPAAQRPAGPRPGR